MQAIVSAGEESGERAHDGVREQQVDEREDVVGGVEGAEALEENVDEMRNVEGTRFGT